MSVEKKFAQSNLQILLLRGVAIATALTMAVWNIWLHQLVVKHIGVQPSIISTFL